MPARLLIDTARLHPKTTEQVQKILTAFYQSDYRTYQELFDVMDVTYKNAWGVFHCAKGAEHARPASPYFLSKAQKALGIDLGVPKDMPKTTGRTPGWYRIVPCPVCAEGHMMITKTSTKNGCLALCEHCKTRVRLNVLGVEDLAQEVLIRYIRAKAHVA